jgi:uncharacterized protein (DUF2236 family)
MSAAGRQWRTVGDIPSVLEEVAAILIDAEVPHALIGASEHATSPNWGRDESEQRAERGARRRVLPRATTKVPARGADPMYQGRPFP